MDNKYFLIKTNFLVILFTAFVACNNPNSTSKFFRNKSQLVQSGNDVVKTAQNTLKEIKSKINQLNQEKEDLTQEITTLGKNIQNADDKFHGISISQAQLIALKEAKISSLTNTTQQLINKFNSDFEAMMKALLGGESISNEEVFEVRDESGNIIEVNFQKLTPVQKQEVLAEKIAKLKKIKANITTETQKLTDLQKQFGKLTQKFNQLKQQVNLYITKTTTDLKTITKSAIELNKKVTTHTSSMNDKTSKLTTDINQMKKSLKGLGLSEEEINKIIQKSTEAS